MPDSRSIEEERGDLATSFCAWSSPVSATSEVFLEVSIKGVDNEKPDSGSAGKGLEQKIILHGIRRIMAMEEVGICITSVLDQLVTRVMEDLGVTKRNCPWMWGNTHTKQSDKNACVTRMVFEPLPGVDALVWRKAKSSPPSGQRVIQWLFTGSIRSGSRLYEMSIRAPTLLDEMEFSSNDWRSKLNQFKIKEEL